MIKNGEKITVESVQDDLNIMLEELLKNPNEFPRTKSMEQLEYDLNCLNKLLEKSEDQNDAANITNKINLIKRILKTYRAASSPIRISRYNKDRLNEIGCGYNVTITALLDFWDEHH